MRRLIFIEVVALAAVLLLVPAVISAQPEQTQTATPPVSQPLVREGEFAVRLAEALRFGRAESETEAESMLGSAGIAPRNGWIADYPVTPDISSEIRDAVADAADSNRLGLGKDEALNALDNVNADFGLGVRPYSGGVARETNPPSYNDYPNPSVINNYYYNYGPPVITYYSPPPDFYYLYTWVPYPFWWFDFWFPGYFVLVDFHRVILVHNRVVVITNHFNDFRTHRVHRIDPVERFSGKTFAGIGAPKTKGFISTGVKKESESIFNRNRERERERDFRSGKRSQQPQGRGTIAPSNGSRKTVPSSGVRREVRPPSAEQGKTRPSAGGERRVQQPANESGTSGQPSGGGSEREKRR